MTGISPLTLVFAQEPISRVEGGPEFVVGVTNVMCAQISSGSRSSEVRQGKVQDARIGEGLGAIKTI